MSEKLRLFYAAGPGDVIGTYEQWRAGRADAREVSATYSGQFLDLCAALEARGFVLVQRGGAVGGRRVEGERVTIQERGIPFQQSRRAVLYHLGQMLYGIYLWWKVLEFGAQVAVVSQGTHWFMLGLLRLAGVRVVPDLHCTLWPTGHPPAQAGRRVVNWLNGKFWRRIPSATLCISPECERQVLAISGGRAGTLVATRPTYEREGFDGILPPETGRRPFELLYAGRIEADKGVFDLVEMMRKLEAVRPGGFRCVVCGGGSADEALKTAVTQAGLAQCVELAGQVRRPEMIARYSRCHAVIVPTTALFVEGLNRVVVEGVLAGRPVIVTSVCPAWELLEEASCVVGPGDVAAMTEAAMKLSADAAFYAGKRAACARLAEQFYDEGQSWGAGVRAAVRLALPGREAELRVAGGAA